MSGAGWVRALLMVPVALQAVAEQVALELDFDGGEGTFNVPLAPEGAEEPTFWGAYTLMRPHTLDQVRQILPQFIGAKLYAEIDGWSLESALADAGLALITGAS